MAADDQPSTHVHPLDAHVIETGRIMLCAICSESLNGAILNEDNKWVHPECEANAEWNEEVWDAD
jgi:hypothetical protein